MASVIAQTILDRATIILQDNTNVRWPEDELLLWLNDGQREIVLIAPDAFTKTETVTLVPGSKQSLPAAGIRFITLTRNMPGGSPGRAVRGVDRVVLDSQRPDWHTEDPSATIKHYLFEPNNPKVFWVFPSQPVSPSQAEIVYSAAPPDVVATDPISIDDVYANALLDYILYRAYSKDADYAVNDNRVQNHYRQFIANLTSKQQVDTTVEPQPNRRPQE